ncbi:hypothetical protein [Aequorivita vladivostokensis]|uniref:Uncharacterized protein n=1 Tax=Aequorivita vladivostokensis TaxID=171194 RepID=A0ABR5DHP2_9FLAO|nr:hypothetical protein [Aequorivita vladivostokensis]KJJ38289.1 hypothetical protein MB09_09550 [Aequorivita vladivostokensis]
MKTTKNILFGVLTSILMIPAVWGQTYKGEENNNNGDEKVVSAENMSPQVLANLGIISTPNPKNALIEGNSVYVRQIGDFNTTRIVTRTNASEINLLQNGDYNDTNLDYTANTAVAELVQNGNNNKIKDFVNNPNADISLDLVQDGDYLNFERDGVNELTKSLKFRQSEASPTVIVRSFY